MSVRWFRLVLCGTMVLDGITLYIFAVDGELAMLWRVISAVLAIGLFAMALDIAGRVDRQ